MRKKLLALLMCATMVLGTAVTASAATSTTDAAKVYGENAEKFIVEYYPTDAVLKCSASNGTKGTVEYGYINDAANLSEPYTATVIFKADGSTPGTTKNEYYAATQVVTTYKGQEINSVENVSAAASRVVYDKIGFTTAGKYGVELKDDNGNGKQVVLVEADGSGNFAVTKTEGKVTNTDNWVKLNTGDTLVKASKGILKSTDENSYGTLYSSLGTTTLDDADVISAIDGGVFSKNAVAVKVTAYLQGTIANVPLGLENPNVYGGSAKALYNVDKLQAGKYTFDSDLISRTGFKGAEAVNVFQPTLVASKFDAEMGTLVRDFVKVATVKVGDTITFDNNATFVDGVFVFDKGELAAEPEADKNDGVSDTTTPATDNTASPKTGDVAPIAALAVVMMGAFGAMVVASKKRA